MKNTTNQPIIELEAWWKDDPEDIDNYQTNIPLDKTKYKLPILGGVYSIQNKINGKVYVGSTNNFAWRWRQHQSALRRKDHHNIHLQRAWDKYGPEAFEFQILLIYSGKGLAEWKGEIIALVGACDPQCGYNMDPIVEGRRVVSVETRQKIRNALLGRRNGPPSQETRDKISKTHMGMTASVETRAKIGASSKGRVASDSTRKKMSLSRIGIPRSDETKARISASRKGITNSAETRAKISASSKGKVIGPETRAKMSASHKGKSPTPEARAKSSATQKGKIINLETRERMSESHKGLVQSDLTKAKRRESIKRTLALKKAAKL